MVPSYCPASDTVIALIGNGYSTGTGSGAGAGAATGGCANAVVLHGAMSHALTKAALATLSTALTPTPISNSLTTLAKYRAVHIDKESKSLSRLHFAIVCCIICVCNCSTVALLSTAFAWPLITMQCKCILPMTAQDLGAKQGC